jgi:hypothetical protein
MLVISVLLLELSPLFVAVDALLLVLELLCCCFWLPPCTVLLLVFELLPPVAVDVELPPVAVAPDVLVDVELLPEVLGVVGVGTQTNAMPSTTS